MRRRRKPRARLWRTPMSSAPWAARKHAKLSWCPTRSSMSWFKQMTEIRNQMSENGCQKTDAGGRPLSSVLCLLTSVLCLLTSGCGFHPVYGTRDDNSSVADELNDVAIENIPDRQGQMLRN